MEKQDNRCGRPLRGAEIIVQCLIEQGVRHVFGYPGGYIIDTFDALWLYRDKITHVLTAHEQGACHAADGYARATGRTGVVMSTSGPGATNLVTGIATAYMDSVPLVAVTGNVPLASLGRDSFQEVDITGVTMPVTKHNFIVKDVRDLAPTMREAFAIAASGRPGPVLVDVPKNVQQAVCPYTPAAPAPRSVGHFTPDARARKAADVLSAAKRPLVLAGGGVIRSDACDDLRAFAERHRLPVASTMMGLGCMPADHPLYMGMIGMHGSAAVAKALNECDVLLAVGTRFSDRVAGNPQKFAAQASIVHVDIDTAEIDKVVHSAAHIMGDAGQVLRYLDNAVTVSPDAAWTERCRALKNDFAYAFSSLPLCPRKILHGIAAATPTDKLVATDVGQHQMWTAQSYPVSHPRTLLTSGGLGTMGYGLPAALGAAIVEEAAENPRAVWLVTSDGSIMMNCQELATLAEEGLPVKVLVLNNRGLGMVRQWQRMFYARRMSASKHEFKLSFARLGEAMGCLGLTVQEPAVLARALQQAAAYEGPVVLEVMVDEAEDVMPMVAPGKSLSDMVFEGGDC